MVYTKIYGGLGNQMFQYAAGRALAHRRSVPLCLDTSFFNNMGDCTPRDFLLPLFHIQANIATEEELYAFEKREMSTYFNKFIPYYKRRIVQEPFYHFDPHILSLPDGVLLNGYWQSEKYFSDFSQQIREEFVLRAPFSEDAEQMHQHIVSSNAVSVHFRRGDYVTSESAQKVHGICDLDYYRRAIELIRQRIGDFRLFIFSDDIEWVEKCAGLEGDIVYVSRTGISAPEEMVLMSMCQHHIVANSSFSWWGAWLNKKRDKIVIAPQQWFAKTDMHTHDLVPDSWLRV